MKTIFIESLVKIAATGIKYFNIESFTYVRESKLN